MGGRGDLTFTQRCETLQGPRKRTGTGSTYLRTQTSGTQYCHTCNAGPQDRQPGTVLLDGCSDPTMTWHRQGNQPAVDIGEVLVEVTESPGARGMCTPALYRVPVPGTREPRTRHKYG